MTGGDSGKAGHPSRLHGGHWCHGPPGASGPTSPGTRGRGGGGGGGGLPRQSIIMTVLDLPVTPVSLGRYHLFRA